MKFINDFPCRQTIMLHHVNNQKIFPFLEKISSNYNIPNDELQQLWLNLTKLQIHPTSQYYKLYQKKINKPTKPWRQLTARQKSSFRKKQIQDLKRNIVQSSNEVKIIRSYVEKKYAHMTLEQLRELVQKNYGVETKQFSKEQCLAQILEHDFEVK